MADDRYKYFRIEGREIADALTGGALDLERGSPGVAVVPLLLRHAHTLKGAARVVGATDISDLAHALEEALVAHREVTVAVPPDQVELVATLVDAISAAVGRIDARLDGGEQHDPRAVGGEDLAGRGQRYGREEFETVRVEVEEMDALLEGVAETAVQVAAFRAAAAEMESQATTAAALVDRIERASAGLGAEVEGWGQARALALDVKSSLDDVKKRFAVAADKAGREIAQVRTRAERLRLVPVGVVFDSLERVARDTAAKVGRTIDFETEGGDIRLDQPVLSALRDGLSHVVRNAVAHGIEPPEERAAAGKSREGRIRLVVERRRERVTVRCTDDGRGIDVAAVRRVALERGVISDAEASRMGRDDTLLLLRRGGLSTASSVSQISGRGVGLQVIQAVSERFKGRLELRTDPGIGTTVEVTIPISLSSVATLVAEVSRVTVAFPRDAVSRTLRLKQAEIVRGVDGDTILDGSKPVSFAPLATLLKLDAAVTRTAQSSWNVVVLHTEAGTAALGVDRIQGMHALVVRPLPRSAGNFSVLAGASLDADGNPWLMLDAAGLVKAVRDTRDRTAVLEAPPRPPILVIDDSLTTRMLERTILETAGYEVDVAISAEEGLKKAALRRYGVFIVDVEMPGIDGFEFVRKTRADPMLQETPAILVTSLGTAEHKRRGLEAGARGYIVKGEFDELALLGAIRAIIG